IVTAGAAARAGNGGDIAVGSDLPNQLVDVVHHVDVAGTVHGNAGGLIEARSRTGAIDATLCARRTGNGRDHTRRSHPTDRAIVFVGHDDVAGLVEREAVGEIETRGRTGAVGAADG